MKEKLIELIFEGMRKYHTDGKQYLRESIADYLLENGVIVPPCKVGDTVYCIIDGFDKPMEGYVSRFEIYQNHITFTVRIIGYLSQLYRIDDFNKTVFLTKEEAEQALKERF